MTISFFNLFFIPRTFIERDLKWDAHTVSSSIYHSSVVVDCTVLYCNGTVLYWYYTVLVLVVVLYCTGTGTVLVLVLY